MRKRRTAAGELRGRGVDDDDHCLDDGDGDPGRENRSESDVDNDDVSVEEETETSGRSQFESRRTPCGDGDVETGASRPIETRVDVVGGDLRCPPLRVVGETVSYWQDSFFGTSTICWSAKERATKTSTDDHDERVVCRVVDRARADNHQSDHETRSSQRPPRMTTTRGTDAAGWSAGVDGAHRCTTSAVVVWNDHHRHEDCRYRPRPRHRDAVSC